MCDQAFAYGPGEAKALPAFHRHNWGTVVDSLVPCDYESIRVFSTESWTALYVRPP